MCQILSKQLLLGIALAIGEVPALSMDALAYMRRWSCTMAMASMAIMLATPIAHGVSEVTCVATLDSKPDTHHLLITSCRNTTDKYPNRIFQGVDSSTESPETSLAQREFLQPSSALMWAASEVSTGTMKPNGPMCCQESAGSLNVAPLSAQHMHMPPLH